MNQLIEIQNKALAARIAVTGCGEGAAAKSAAYLVGGYPSLQIHDVKAFTHQLVSAMAQYPADLCEKAATEIPRAERFLNIAAVVAWLEERMHERRTTYAEAVEAQRKAEADTKERAHAEQVAKDKAEFEAWLVDHPGGTLRQFVGITPYVPPFAMGAEDKPDPVLMGPYQSAGHLMGKIVDGEVA